MDRVPGCGKTCAYLTNGFVVIDLAGTAALCCHAGPLPVRAHSERARDWGLGRTGPAPRGQGNTHPTRDRRFAYGPVASHRGPTPAVSSTGGLDWANRGSAAASGCH
jgi:hypothetical protein